MAILRVLLTIQIAIILLIGFASLCGAEPKLSPEFQITPQYDCDKKLPTAVYNYRHRMYLVAWSAPCRAYHGIGVGQVSESGQLGANLVVTEKGGPKPAVAYNGTNDEYLVVWMYNANSDGSTYEIWGRRESWDHQMMGSDFQIITWPTRTFWTPRVAWNSYRNEYLVVWNALDAGTFVPNDIAFVILSATGARLHETIITSAGEPHQVDVTYNIASDEYLVVWRHMDAPGDGDIRGARIRGSDGAVVTPPGIFTIDAEPEDQMLPAVATNQQHRYLVVWQHAFPGPCCDWDIRGRELDVNGGLLGNPIFFASSTDDETKPDVAAKPGNLRDYMVVWQRATSWGEEVRAYRWGDNPHGPFIVASSPIRQNENPVVVAGATSYLIAYDVYYGYPYFDIFGRMWWPEVIYLPLILRQNF